MTRRNVTIRWSLLRNLLLLVALLSGSILTVTFVMAGRTVRRLSADLVTRTEDMVEAQLKRFFEPVTQQLLVAGDWSRSGLLQCRSTECFNRVLPPVMVRVPQISSVNTGDGEGNGVLVLRDPDGWRNREVSPKAWGPRVRWTSRRPDLSSIREWWEDLDYDPRKRPWYQGAVAEGGGIHWTAPYTFKTTQDPGITASIETSGPEGTPFVLAYDVMLRDLSEFTAALHVSAHGIAFVTTADGAVVGLPRDVRWRNADDRKPALLKPADTLGIPALAETVSIGRARAGDDTAVFEFTVDGEAWWGGLRRFRLEGGPAFSIGVAVPEDDFLGEVRHQRLLILLLTAAALAGAVAISMFLARRYSRPLEALVLQSDRISELDMERGSETPSNLVEITRLHEAQERMRSALDSFARYVPTEVVRDLLRRGEAAQIGGRTEELTILFTDIEGFTSVSEGLTVDELTTQMAEYFDVMLSTLRECGATIDKLIGDAIVAFWGAPSPVPGHPRLAVEAVVRCEERLDALNRRWTEQGRPALPTRYGLALGNVLVGNVGTPSRLHYTVLGDTVNLASRLEGANKLYGTRVLAEGRIVEAAGDGFLWRRVDRVAVKGRRGAVDLHHLLGRRGEVPEREAEAVRRYEKALDAFRARRFDDAMKLLHPLEADADGSVIRLLHLCRQFRIQPPPDDWDGVNHLSEK